MTEDEEILAAAVAWKRQGKGVAIATVTATWGSSPRPVGSKLTIRTTSPSTGDPITLKVTARLDPGYHIYKQVAIRE